MVVGADCDTPRQQLTLPHARAQSRVHRTGTLDGPVQVLLQKQDQRQTRVVSRAAAAQIGATKQMDGGGIT